MDDIFRIVFYAGPKRDGARFLDEFSIPRPRLPFNKPETSYFRLLRADPQESGSIVIADVLLIPIGGTQPSVVKRESGETIKARCLHAPTSWTAQKWCSFQKARSPWEGLVAATTHIQFSSRGFGFINCP